MSLLLDALKKAAEKNAQNDAPAIKEKEADKTDLAVGDDTIVVDKTEIADQELVDQALSVPVEAKDDENVTELELAQIINAQKNTEAKEALELEGEQAAELADDDIDEQKNISDDTVIESAPSSLEDETIINANKLTIDDVKLDSDPSLALYEDNEDPSLKLALSDEEILLTDDDVTEFLGGDELYSRLGDEELSLEEETDLKLSEDRTTTQSLNLAEPPTGFTLSRDDTTTGLGLTSTTTNAGQTTNLNSLTNEAALNTQDSTSTQTFASDNYDRTLVKLEDDVSKVFTGMKSANSGAAMTPDFAKKVFVHKSTSLRRQNYKIYAFISLAVLISISVFALFEMQTQIDDIDTSLVRLKQNPVPSELRFKREEKTEQDNAILQGRVDTEALNLLKSLAQKSENSTPQNAQPDVSKQQQVAQNKTDSVKDEALKTTKNDVKPVINKEAVAQTEEAVAQTKVEQKIEESTPETPEKFEPIATANTKQPKASTTVAKETKAEIDIETKIVESKESIWLRDAYSAFERGDLDVAALNYAQVLDKDSNNRDALLGQAAIYSMQNKSSQAIDNYQAVLLENPKDPLAMTSLIAASAMSPIESESRLKLLQRESPNATYLQFALGNVVSAQNRWQEAQQYYYEAYQAEPTNADYAYNLAVSLEQINKPDIAVNYYEQALKNAQTMHATFNVDIIKQRIEVLSQ